MENKRRIVITGIGPVTGIGIGKEKFWGKLLEGKIELSRIPDRFERNYSFRSKFYVPFPHFSLDDFGISARYSSLMEESSKVSLVATKLALDDSGLLVGNNVIKDYNSESINVVFGVGIGSLQTMLDSYALHNFGDRHDILDIVNLKPPYNRMAIPTVMPNSASSWVSIYFGVRGSNYTVNSACSSGSFAIGEAYRRIRDGYAEMVIAGGIECLREKNGTVMRGFDMLDALTKSEDGIPRPFSYNRSGFLFSEGGACTVILEEYGKAIQRGARIYAEIIAFESNSDAYNIVQIDPSGKQIKNLIRKTIANHHIDYINSHGTGTLTNDKIEYETIKEIFGDFEMQPRINSTKSILGHTIGASGSIELAVTALSVYESKVHQNLSENTFEDLNLIKSTCHLDINYALSTSFGFGGHNCAVLIGKPE
jgi:3-oxoacyl-[acyl-carrier-protein] synthase II